MDVQSKKISPLKAWGIVILGISFYCYQLLLRIIPDSIGSQLETHYGISNAQVLILMGFYYFTYTPMQIPVGILLDRVRIRLLISATCGICVLGAVLFVGTPYVMVAGVGRALLGFGSAFAFVSAMKLGAVLLPPRQFGFVSGFAMTVSFLIAKVGSDFMPQLIDRYGWENVYYGLIAPGVVLTALLFLLIGELPTESVSSKKQVRWGEVFSNTFRLLKEPRIFAIGIVSFLIYTALSGFAEVGGIKYLEKGHGLSQSDATCTKNMFLLGFAIGSLLIGLLADYLRRRTILIILGTILSGICIGIVVWFPGKISLDWMKVLVFGYGFFCGSVMLTFVLAKEYTSLKLAGTVVAVTNFLNMMSGVVLQPLIGNLLAYLKGGDMDDIMVYKIVFIIFPIAQFLAAGVTFFLKNSVKEEHKK